MNLRIFRWTGLYVVMMLLLVAPGLIQAQEAAPGEQSAEILWDTWGVPHIYAPDNESLFYAFGWSQMHNHANLILRLYAQARGEAAAYVGEAALEGDVFIQTMGIPDRSLALYEAQTPEVKAYLDAFIAGMNDYAAANPDQINEVWAGVLPVRGQDVLADWLRILVYFQSNPRSPIIAKAKEWQSDQVGSNGWAVAPSRSASGNAMLVVNPHVPWGDMFITMEAQLTSPDVNIYGATFVGLPIMAYGFNENLGWTMTVNPIDIVDLYELTLVDETHYLLDGEPQPLDIQEVTVQVKQEDGTLQPHTFPVARSLHGPLVAQGEGKALALRLAGTDRSGIIAQLWAMAQADNLAEFEAALEQLQLPMFNVIYTDRAGNIMHLFNGLIPKHADGDWASWQQIQPGDDSSLIWNEYHSYDELPKVVNPPTGWLQNANESPWTDTLPPVLNPADFPAYISAPPNMSFRPQTSARLLSEDDSITFDELVEYKHSTLSELANRVLDDLLVIVEDTTDVKLLEAAEVLNAWDRHTNADSQGGVLFAEWWARYQQTAAQIFTTPYDFAAEPFTTPDGLADTDAALTALTEAAAFVEENFGALDVAWGDVYRVKIAGQNIPANGGDGELGIFRVVWAGPWALGAPLDGEKQYAGTGGDGFVAVVEFGDDTMPYAQVLMTYGNASQPGSPHAGDQLALFAEQKLRVAWVTRESVEEHLENSETLTFQP